MSPTQRSLKLLRDDGYTVAIVERWNPYARIRQDLFGFADLLAFKGDLTLAVQTTSGSNVSARIAKILSIQAAHLWLSPSRKIIVHGWRKLCVVGQDGKKQKRKEWQCRIEEIQL